jgi:hypothetical protein
MHKETLLSLYSKTGLVQRLYLVSKISYIQFLTLNIIFDCVIHGMGLDRIVMTLVKSNAALVEAGSKYS